MNLDDPQGRLAFIETYGHDAYDKAMDEKFNRSVVRVVNGHRIAGHTSQWGRIFLVHDTVDPKQGIGYLDLAQSIAHAKALPQGTFNG